MTTNKSELVEVNGCGAIASNDKAANKVYFVSFTYLPYTLREYV